MPVPSLPFEIELPARFATCEPKQAQAYLSKLFRQHSLSLAHPSSQLEFLHSAATLGNDLSMHHLAYGREIFNAGAASGDVYLAVFTLAGTLRMRVGDQEIISPAGTVCVMNPHQSFSTHLSADHQQLTLCVSGNLLRQLLTTYDLQPTYPLEFLPVPTDTLDQAGTLMQTLMTLCHQMGRHSSALSRPQIAMHFEQLIAALLLAEVPHNYATPADQTCDHAPDYIHKAIRFIHAQDSMRITVQDIARAVSVTPRTLQIGFRRHLGVTPRTFLRNVRLDHARRTLSESGARRTKVSNIAQDHGFASMSKFARHFRERFGQNPSAVTRRRT